MLMPALFGENLIDEFLDDFGGFPFYENGKRTGKARNRAYGRGSAGLMKTDIKETEKSYILAIDLPGFKKEDIQASIEDGRLTVSASRTVENENDRYLRRERYSGSLQRSFYLGEDICREEVSAEFKHGVLKLVIPKKDPAKAEETSNFISIE